MDFLGAYVPSSPTKFTPRGNGQTFDDAPDQCKPCEEEHLQDMKNGDYSKIRELRKTVEKRKTAVQFIAPISEDGSSLKSIHLTPSVKSKSGAAQFKFHTKKIVEATPQKEDEGTKERFSFFGFKIRRSGSH